MSSSLTSEYFPFRGIKSLKKSKQTKKTHYIRICTSFINRQFLTEASSEFGFRYDLNRALAPPCRTCFKCLIKPAELLSPSSGSDRNMPTLSMGFWCVRTKREENLRGQIICKVNGKTRSRELNIFNVPIIIMWSVRVCRALDGEGRAEQREPGHSWTSWRTHHPQSHQFCLNLEPLTSSLVLNSSGSSEDMSLLSKC